MKIYVTIQIADGEENEWGNMIYQITTRRIIKCDYSEFEDEMGALISELDSTGDIEARI